MYIENAEGGAGNPRPTPYFAPQIGAAVRASQMPVWSSGSLMLYTDLYPIWSRGDSISQLPQFSVDHTSRPRTS